MEPEVLTEPETTLQTLPLECLLQIVSYITLPDCITLRSVCGQLKTAVDEHFRADVRTLPVLLSARYSPESVAQYEEHFRKDFSYKTKAEKIKFGSTSGWFMMEYKDVFPDRKQYFRRENYFVLFDIDKFDGFLHFIATYLPGITKLALLVDHDDHMDNISAILSIYRKQLKVLSLEKTLHSTMKLTKIAHNCSRLYETFFNPPEGFYDSLETLDALEELYFFTKSAPTFRLGGNGGRTLNRMALKLKVFHITCDFFGFDLEAYENLEEVAAYGNRVFKHDHQHNQVLSKFPRLISCMFLDTGSVGKLLPEQVPNLKELSIDSALTITIETIDKLNSFDNLEQIHCDYFDFTGPTQRSADMTPNRTIKVIELNRLKHPTSPRFTDRVAHEQLKGCLWLFQGLKRLSVREPKIELNERDIRFLSRFTPEYL